MTGKVALDNTTPANTGLDQAVIAKYPLTVLDANGDPIVTGEISINSTGRINILVNGMTMRLVARAPDGNLELSLNPRDDLSIEFRRDSKDKFILNMGSAGDIVLEGYDDAGDFLHDILYVARLTGVARFYQGLRADKFGVMKSPVSQQTGSAYSAGAAYGSNEQAMLQKVYDVLTAYGLYKVV